MVAKGLNSPPGWKTFLAAACAPRSSLEERESLVQPVITLVQAVLDENITQSAGSQTLFTALAVGTLNMAVSGLDPDNPYSYWQLLAVNDVVIGSDRRLALVLVEHNFLNALWRLHQRAGKMSHRLSQAVVLVFCSVALRAEGAAGSMETIAAKPELGELLVSHLTFLAVTPDALLTPAGLGTAQRCLQTCWEITRAPTPKCRAFRELLQQLHMAGRALQMAAIAVSGAAAGSAAGSEAQAAIAAVAALEGREGAGGATGAAAAAQTDGAASSYDGRLSLAAQACSFAANLAGLGSRGIELSAAGLAPHRAWLLKPGSLAALRPPLEGLVAGLEALRRRIEAQQGVGEDASGRQQLQEAAAAEDADLRTGRIPPARLLGQVEGSVRNVLMLLGLPTIVMGTGEEDVVESCGFVIRHSFGLFTEGYVDVMRSLRAAVSDPAPGSFTAPYPGDYGPFFRAFAGHIETVAPALGVQLEDWGVRFTGEQAARDLPVMEVGEGVDARIAHAWLKDQIQQIINWGHAMMMIVRMADQAKMAALQQQQQQGQQAGDAAGAGGAAGPGQCASCGATQQAAGPPLLWCSRCKSVRYCSRACQVGHWPQHKGTCQAAAAATAAAATTADVPGPARTSAVVPEKRGEAAATGVEGVADAGGAAPVRSVDVEGLTAAAAREAGSGTGSELAGSGAVEAAGDDAVGEEEAEGAGKINAVVAQES